MPFIETSGFDLMEEVKDDEHEASDESNIEEIPVDDVPEESPTQEPDGDKGEKDRPEVILQSDLSFEPFHTVDYFASQGIKLSQEEFGKGQFGRQLKSFTEWLKTMKRLPATEQMKKLDPHSEEKVENIAAHSIDNSEILTEAMAEVWMKQGKTEKAIEVYNKLSLLNPSKRSYFAAKLENLKKAI
jgi:predicted Zn-dependent protease